MVPDPTYIADDPEITIQSYLVLWKFSLPLWNWNSVSPCGTPLTYFALNPKFPFPVSAGVPVNAPAAGAWSITVSIQLPMLVAPMLSITSRLTAGVVGPSSAAAENDAS